jgi:hypothetical protein
MADARAASSPEGPEPMTRTFSLSPLVAIFSGGQPRRHSSLHVGFWEQRPMPWVISPVMQMLQPIHSRMSSTRPSSIRHYREHALKVLPERLRFEGSLG